MDTIEVMRDILHHPQQLVTEAKSQGKKVIGYRCIYVPEEIIHAADMLPYPLFGTPEPITVADSYLQSNVCEFIRNLFDLALSGKMDFLDGLVLCNTCDAVRRFHYYWNTYIKTPQAYIINNPQMMQAAASSKYYSKEIEMFKGEMEKLAGAEINSERLHNAIELYNETRRLLRELFSLRKSNPPPISGSEALDIAMASMLMPKEKCNQLLPQLIQEVKDRKEMPQDGNPRILLTGSIIDNPTLIQLVEESGGTVVAEDLCTSIKYFWHEVKENKDPLDALCQHNMERCFCACTHPPEARFDYLQELIHEFDIDGVIYFNLKYCDPFAYEAVLFRDKLQDLGIPTIVLEAEHNLSGMGQLKTRVQAFLEML